MTRKYKITCKSCNKYNSDICYRKTSYEHDGIEPCESYKRSGGKPAKTENVGEAASIDTVIQCKEGGCKYYDEKLKSRCSRGDDPENCLHYEFQPIELRRQESKPKNLSGIPNLKLERSKPDKVEKQHTHKEKPAFSCRIPTEPLMSFSEFLEAIKTQGFEIVIRPVKT
jgi:hypothetical protein